MSLLIGCPPNLILHNKDNLFSYVNLPVFPILVQCLLPHCRGGKFVINTVYFSCLVKFELVYLYNPPKQCCQFFTIYISLSNQSNLLLNCHPILYRAVIFLTLLLTDLKKYRASNWTRIIESILAFILVTFRYSSIPHTESYSKRSSFN